MLRPLLSRLPSARALILALASLEVLAAERGQAVVIPIDLGTPGLSFDTTVPFLDLNGTALQGQTLSLDFTFTNNHFVRLFTVTNSFSAFVTLATKASGLAGFLEGTGFLVNDQGNPLHAPQDLGSASSSSGEMFVSLFPPPLKRPVDFFGVHLDLTFPDNPSVAVTGGQFRLRTDGDSGPFGIGPGIPADIVPDLGSSLFLLSIALAGLFGIGRSLLPIT